MFSILCTNVAIAGDYGLGANNSITTECRHSIKSALNYCHAERISSDLFRHFRDGKEYEIEASHYGFDRGNLFFKGDDERKIIYGAIASLIALEKPYFEKELLDIVRRFPFRSMRSAIKKELENKENPEAGLKRLSIAYKIVEENYRG